VLIKFSPAYPKWGIIPFPKNKNNPDYWQELP